MRPAPFPQLDRRAVAAGLAALALPGCATTRPESAASTAARGLCLPPVKASPDRMIRAVAGLRPYRKSGFVVRRDTLGDTALVHNYGHGGAGITLSWGTSRLAVDLGLPGHTGPVAVIGCGVMGLSTARLVQDAGFAVTIYTDDLPPATTSNIAGGQWHPYGHFDRDSVTPQWRAQFLAAADYSWRRFQLMIGDAYGIRWLPTYNLGGTERQLLPTFPPENHELTRAQHPFPIDRAARFTTMYVETGRYLRQLIRDFRIAGGAIARRKFTAPGQLAELPESLVFNCTGLGSHNLFGDTGMTPARGQLAILLPQPEIEYAYTGRFGYMFPRPDGILLGGTFETGQWDATPQDADIARIIDGHRRLHADLRCPA
ncbi:FAD-dependent oxidoreductase [Stakelama tenebrarum]|uniref:D-amino-acid oxidase n=1 Tax=Stakelama tenebrarum TaxID=2711215 RepID=A0A6G6Y3M3_9SPHN|nr:FAD-dependent oxidoreductase [Sphingosinithalassobacter tenebrarum]QIG79318.1 FAD-dependent oxidoreductase [Sphingosinithalassobacter tenebrarum]